MYPEDPNYSKFVYEYILEPDHSIRPARSKDETMAQWKLWSSYGDGKFVKGHPKVVDKTRIGEMEVSTVFLGLNHNFTMQGPPILFETMVFGQPDDDEICERYETWDEAQKGHDEIVARLKKELDDHA